MDFRKKGFGLAKAMKLTKADVKKNKTLKSEYHKRTA